MKNITYKILFLLLFVNQISFSQDLNDLVVAKSLNTVFSSVISSKNLQDSAFIYAANFKLDIIKRDKKAIVVKISANDSLAFQFLPNYKDFLKIDFNNILEDRSQISVIIPFLIFNLSDHSIKYKDENRKPLINGYEAVKSAIKLLSTESYIEVFLKNGKTSFKKSEKLSVDQVKKLIFLETQITELININ